MTQSDKVESFFFGLEFHLKSESIMTLAKNWKKKTTNKLTRKLSHCQSKCLCTTTYGASVFLAGPPKSSITFKNLKSNWIAGWKAAFLCSLRLTVVRSVLCCTCNHNLWLMPRCTDTPWSTLLHHCCKVRSYTIDFMKLSLKAKYSVSVVCLGAKLHVLDMTHNLKTWS